jgi:hypothetical protein
MRAASAKYDFLTLATWLFQLTPVHSIRGAVGIGIDERRNRVAIGFSDSPALPQIEALVSHLGIPQDGVIIERQPSVVFTSSLGDFVRPVENGFAIDNDGSNFSPCVIGLNASQDGTGAAYAVLAGHCVRIVGVANGTEFFQPNRQVAPTRLGVQIASVPYFAGDNTNGCASGRFCTYADATLMKYDNDADRDVHLSIPVTDFRSGPGQGPGSTQVSFASQIYAVEGYNILPAMQGAILDRVGPEAGWTYGQVQRKCFDVDISGSQLTILCQTQVSGLQMHGDSGSQVFSTQNGTFYYLYGMATTAFANGSGFFYNPMSSIIGQLNTNSYPLYFCGC